jgi:hypothetical protein
MQIRNANILGAVVSIVILCLCNLIFIFRLSGRQNVEYWLGWALILMILPLVFLLIDAKQLPRPTIYFVQIVLMISFLIMELFLDYIFKLEFRMSITWLTIIYIVLFYAATGGMIGLAANAGTIWIVAAVFLFFTMVILSLIQRSITGL